MKQKTIKLCKECAWAKLPSYDKMVFCRFHGFEVYEDSQPCENASDIGLL